MTYKVEKDSFRIDYDTKNDQSITTKDFFSTGIEISRERVKHNSVQESGFQYVYESEMDNYEAFLFYVNGENAEYDFDEFSQVLEKMNEIHKIAKERRENRMK